MLTFAPTLLIGLITLSACSPIDSAQTQQRDHQKILLQYNGLIDSPVARAYVKDIGQRIIAVTPTAQRDWEIYVLDSPQVNAYVSDSGSIYVTRGLMMLANSEAELAAVMAHEIAHLVADHSVARSQRMEEATRQLWANALVDTVSDQDQITHAQHINSDVIGGFAAFTREQEIDADQRGLHYLAEAGYTPTAMPDFLRAMIAHDAIEALLAGRPYDPTQTRALASHPTSAHRLATITASLPSIIGGAENRDIHLDVIDGLVWGADGRNGLIQDNRWIDLQSGLSFTAPMGLTLTVGELSVRAADEDGREMSFSRLRPRGLTPTRYLAELWLPYIGIQDFVEPRPDIHSTLVQGRETAYVDIPLHAIVGATTVRLVAVAQGDEILAFTLIAPMDDQSAMDSLFATVQTIRILPPEQLRALAPTHLRIVSVAPGQGVDDLSAMMQVQRFPRQQFLALNNLPADARLQAGQRVKILAQ